MIYQLKIVLRRAVPPVWRRIQISGDATLNRLHHVIQAVMGWGNCHLHEFVTSTAQLKSPSFRAAVAGQRERRFGDPRAGDADDDALVTIHQLLHDRRSLEYQYDFGDSWDHKITVEKIIEPETGAAYPRCIAGAGRCPMEDCGGIPGWMDLVRIINDPLHAEGPEMRQWAGLTAGETLDPAAFTLAEADAALERCRKHPEPPLAAAAAKPPPAAPSPLRDVRLPENLRLTSYEIVAAPLPDPRYALPPEMERRIDALFDNLDDDPDAAIAQLTGMLKEHPNAPRLLNYLSSVHNFLGDDVKARKFAELNYRHNPTYLFAKLNVAEYLLREWDLDGVRRVMNDRWDVTFHEPGRSRFHITEVMGVLGIAGRYFAGVGELEVARRYLDMIRDIDSLSPAAAAVQHWISHATLSQNLKIQQSQPRGSRQKARVNERKKNRRKR